MKEQGKSRNRVVTMQGRCMGQKNAHLHRVPRHDGARRDLFRIIITPSGHTHLCYPILEHKDHSKTTKRNKPRRRHWKPMALLTLHLHDFENYSRNLPVVVTSLRLKDSAFAKISLRLLIRNAMDAILKIPAPAMSYHCCQKTGFQFQ